MSELSKQLNRLLCIGHKTIEKRLVLSPMAFIGNIAFRELVSIGSICRQNCGAAVLKTPDLAARIVAAVRNAVCIPLFVKFRTGWSDDPQPSCEMAQRFEDAGADALTFHPRVAPDRRGRPPKWEYIGAVKQSVSIPVFGNGNVFDQHDCATMLQSTGCDGVAIGRIAIARPWVFAEWTEDLKPGPQIFLESALQLARLLQTHYDSVKAFRRFKRFAFYFAANFQFGHSLYTRISNAPDMTAVQDVLRTFFDTTPEMLQRPNMNFFK